MSGRTPEEREAARLERERRRVARGGEPVAPPPPPPPEPPQPPQPQPRPQQPPLPEPEPPRAPEPEPEPVTMSEKADMVGLFHQDPDPDLDLDEGFETDEHDVPAGTRRVSALHRGRASGGGARPPRAPRRARRSADGGRHRSWRGRAGAVVAIALAVALVWFLVSLFQPFHGSGGAPVRVEIPPHLTSRQVGDLLAREGVVSSGFFFELRATLAGERSKLRAGTYTLRRDESYGDVLGKLTTPPPAARTTELTVIEGTTRAQLAKLLHTQGIHGNYLTASRRSRLLDPAAYGARGAPSLEGFLFPDTYQLREPITAGALIADQLTTFKRQFRTVSLGAAHHVNLTAYDVLIIASLVQGEARTAGDRARIASVIYNRLRARMPLQIDATVRYATGNYTRPITVSELHSRSPWNTYTHLGLPRTPIDSPGLAAIQAAAHPAHTKYLFFVVKPCGNGASAFASTYAQFQLLEAQYNAARARRGGRSPEFCHPRP